MNVMISDEVTGVHDVGEMVRKLLKINVEKIIDGGSE